VERALNVPVLDGAHVLSRGHLHEAAHHADGEADVQASVQQVAEATNDAVIEGEATEEAVQLRCRQGAVTSSN